MRMIRRLGLGVALALLAPTMAHAADPTAGATFFRQRCTLCHVVAPGAKPTLAPNLFGIAGTVSGEGNYPFSPAMKKARIKWDAKTLDAFLAAPTKLVPGTRMIVAVPNADMRANVVAYLMGLRQ